MSVATGRSSNPPIYESLAERLRGSIRSGEFAHGALLGSEHELARRESISRMTVRKASELLISEGLVERRPGKGLYVVKTQRGLTGGLIQVVVGNLLWETSLLMSRGVQAAAREDGVHVQLYDAHGDVNLDLSMIERLPSTDAKGAVIVSLHSQQFSQAICRLHASGFPFVLLDQRMRDIDVSAVTADNYGGGFAVGQMLTAKGHKRLAFVGDLIAATVLERLSGYRDAIGDAGIAFRRSMVVDLVAGADRFGDWSDCIAVGVKRLMEDPEPPTVIFCSCDAIARLVYKSLESMGLKVPVDVSVVGYDDDPLAEYLSPALTTVRQPFQRMGQVAMEMLRRRIAAPQAAAEFQALPIELVERESVAPPRQRD